MENEHKATWERQIHYSNKKYNKRSKNRCFKSIYGKYGLGLVKCRTEAISFSIKEARRACEHVNSLMTQLRVSEEKVAITPTPLLIKEMANFENILKIFMTKRQEVC